MKTYLYNFDKQSGLSVALASLQYEEGTDSYKMNIEHNNEQVILDVYPEELAELYDGVLGEDMLHRIKFAVAELHH